MNPRPQGAQAAPHKPSLSGQQPAGHCAPRWASHQHHPLLGTSGLPARRAVPLPPAIRFSKNASGLDLTTLAPQHRAQTCPHATVWPTVSSEMLTRVTVARSQQVVAWRPSRPSQSAWVPGDAGQPPPPGRSHTQSSLYGTHGPGTAACASGKPRFGLSPRAQQAFVLTPACPHLAGLLSGESGHQDAPSRTARTCSHAPAASTLHIRSSWRTYCALGKTTTEQGHTEQPRQLTRRRSLHHRRRGSPCALAWATVRLTLTRTDFAPSAANLLAEKSAQVRLSTRNVGPDTGN